jgi:hypothetical protein
MFTVGDFKVYFRHYPEEWGYLSTDFVIIPSTYYRGKTVCYIDSLDGEALCNGYAYCSPNDTFDKVKGRKISLARALEGLDKATRAQVWAKYLETSRRL